MHIGGVMTDGTITVNYTDSYTMEVQAQQTQTITITAEDTAGSSEDPMYPQLELTASHGTLGAPTVTTPNNDGQNVTYEWVYDATGFSGIATLTLNMWDADADTSTDPPLPPLRERQTSLSLIRTLSGLAILSSKHRRIHLQVSASFYKTRTGSQVHSWSPSLKTRQWILLLLPEPPAPHCACSRSTILPTKIGMAQTILSKFELQIPRRQRMKLILNLHLPFTQSQIFLRRSTPASLVRALMKMTRSRMQPLTCITAMELQTQRVILQTEPSLTHPWSGCWK